MKKVQYLEGLRGLAALIVVFAHYVQFYYSDPLFYNPQSSLEYYLSKTPFNLTYNGNFAVCVFFVLSGYVLSMKFFQEKSMDIIYSSAVRRYIRLAIPVLFSVFLAYILLLLDLYDQFGKYTGDLRYESMEHNFFSMLKTSLYEIFFNYSNTYNGVLWTMTYEFLGSFLIFSFLALFGQANKRYYLYIFLVVFFWDSYYLAFILGLVLSDMHNSSQVPKSKYRGKLTFLVLLVGLFFGSYPYGSTEGTIYHFLNINILNVKYFTFYHILGAFFLVYALLNSKISQSIFSMKIFVYLGRISFPLYLVHMPILASLSFLLFDYFSAIFSYRISFLISFSLSIFFTFLLSHFTEKFVDKRAIKISKYIYEKFFKVENGTKIKRIKQPVQTMKVN